MGGRGGSGGGGKGGGGSGGGGGGAGGALSDTLEQHYGDMQTEYGRSQLRLAQRIARDSGSGIDAAAQLNHAATQLTKTIKIRGGNRIGVGLSHARIFGSGSGNMSDAQMSAARVSDAQALRAAARAVKPPRTRTS